MYKILLSILHYNKPEQTLECLRSLNDLNQDGIDLEVLLIDNGSKEILTIQEKLYPKLKIEVKRNEKNLGFSGGHNVGFKYGLSNQFDFVMILNNDTIVDKDLIQELLRPFAEKEKIGVTVPKMYFTPNHEFHKDRYKKEDIGKVLWYAGGKTDWGNIISYHLGVDEVDKGQYDTQKETEFASGACMMIKREVLESVGGFNEKYFLYYEDGDLNMRIKKKGYKILYVPTAILWHNNAGSSGSGSILQDYYISRNRMLFGMTYAPIKSKLLLVKESLKLLAKGREWQKKGIKDFYIRKFGKGSFG